MRKLTKVDHLLEKSFEMLNEEEQEDIFNDMEAKKQTTLVEFGESQPEEKD